jgi:hypothetical protein
MWAGMVLSLTGEHKNVGTDAGGGSMLHGLAPAVLGPGAMDGGQGEGGRDGRESGFRPVAALPRSRPARLGSG